ncbi:hypothetical protein AWC38_SpisGene2094 [Stylophora pistillata]|uniref:Integrase catalytic domain-containing protein n=1 Tax=Stylophora pistillata TaxID=50429 RepID=A0A2B4SWT9_STYPI|nr:hypothetical protein AWC38_SpisGene2094 [Stylophora pistillata]
MIGGALINATAFVGGSYVAKYLSGDKNSVEEEKRHDLAVEKYQAAYEKYQENRAKLLDWIAANDRIKKEANQNLIGTDYALKLYKKAHSEELDMKEPHFSNFFKPSTQQKQVHQGDLLFLPYGKLFRKVYKYALAVVDVASRFKAAEPLTSKESSEVSKALQTKYKRGPLRWPKNLQVDPGPEFRGETKEMTKHDVRIRRGNINVHRDQGIVERFNRTLGEHLSSLIQARDELQRQNKINRMGEEASRSCFSIKSWRQD